MGIRKSDDVLDAEWRSLEKQPLSKRPPQLVVPTRPKSSRLYHAWVYVFTNAVFTILFLLSIDTGWFVLTPIVMSAWTFAVRKTARKYMNSK